MLFQKFETTTNIVESENYFKSLPFTKFAEHSIASHKTGIPISKLSELAHRLQEKYNLSDNSIKDIEDIEYVKLTNILSKDFIYSQTGDSFYTCNRIAAVLRNDNKVDMAYHFYNTTFQLAPTKSQYTVDNKTWYEIVPRELSDQQINHIKNVLNKKCMAELNMTLPASIINHDNL